jgi:indolepyruvate ferredoxin oxidoreductase beta subunit
MLAKLRPLRPIGYRFKEEQAMIEHWLGLVRRAAAVDQRLALEVAQCARLIKGYDETRRRGIDHFRRITEEIVAPALAGQISLDTAVEKVEQLCRAALADPEAKIPTPVLGSTAKTDQTETQPTTVT